MKLKKEILSGLIIMLFFYSNNVMSYDNNIQDLIKEDYKQGTIGLDSFYLLTLDSIFIPNKLPDKYKSKIIAPYRGLSTLLSEIKTNWDLLKPETKKILQYIYMRPTDPIFSYNGVDLRYQVPEASPYDTPHFRIHYVLSTKDAPDLTDIVPPFGVPDYVSLVGDTFEYCYQIEITNLGYKFPLSDGVRGGNDKYDVYLNNIGSIGYGITFGETKVTSRPNTFTSYILLDNDYSSLEFETTHTSTEYLQVTAAHEYFHAIQNSYDSDEDRWWKEASATWMEDEVYTNINDYKSYFLYTRKLTDGTTVQTGWFVHPEISLDEFGPAEDPLHQYGSSIFCKYLSEKHSGSNTIKTIWDKCVDKNSLDSIAIALGDTSGFGSKFQLAFSSFVLTNYYRLPPEGYTEGSLYPIVHIEDFSDKASQNEHVFQAGTRGNGVFPDENIPELDHLSSQYIKFIQPKLVDKPTKMHINFAVKGGVWDSKVVRVLNTGQKVAMDLPLDGVIYDFGISSPALSNQTKEIIFIPINKSDSANNKPYNVIASVVPQFREIYTPNTDNGTTKTIKNLKNINHWFNGDTIELEVTLSGEGSITGDDVDFSQFDSNFNKRNVSISSGFVTSEGIKYTITYSISTTNTNSGQKTATIKVYDLLRNAYNTDISFAGYVGYNILQLTTGQSGQDSSISPDGSEVAFVRSRQVVPFEWVSEIWKIRADGSGLTQLTHASQHNYHEGPCWSPTGSYISYTWLIDKENIGRCGIGLCVMNSDGSNQQVFLPTTRDHDWYERPDGTPYDGDVVFHRADNVGSQHGIYKWSSESGMQYLVYSDTYSAPAWAPDKTKIAYRSNDNNIWIMNNDGSNNIKITADGSVKPYCTLDWSPDGKKIIFAREEGGGHNPIKYFLWIMNIDGTNQVKLLEGLNPSWSMNGSKISFDKESDVYVMILKPDNLGIQQPVLAQQIKPNATFKSGEVYSYPNPAKNGKTSKIHIECGIADKVDFDIYDTAGQMIHSTEMIGMPNVIWENKYAYEYAWDISNIASGVYVYIVKALKEGEKEIKAIGKIGIIK
ncbi:MAG: hypothetical protein A2539_00885 [Elusimicrobia bacterium RIFOXYD2_FULL_34_15]|nr:MAG: hypothetical protein A2539_00885 [Elusimicrobia bacterium RIFOXYD2_FULL_34_15]